MYVLEHPFFQYLYIDQEEGCYWHTQKQTQTFTLQFGMLIPTPSDVTPENLTRAQQYIENYEHFVFLARNAVEEHRATRPNGLCAQYIAHHLTTIDTDIARAIIPQLENQALSHKNFVDVMHPVLITIYPADSLVPLVIDLSIGEEFTSQVLSISFSPDDVVASIDYVKTA